MKKQENDEILVLDNQNNGESEGSLVSVETKKKPVSRFLFLLILNED